MVTKFLFLIAFITMIMLYCFYWSEEIHFYLLTYLQVNLRDFVKCSLQISPKLLIKKCLNFANVFFYDFIKTVKDQ